MIIGIIFSTERNEATIRVVNWLKSALEQKGHDIKVGRPGNYQDFDCDGFIVGSAVYAFQVQKVLLEFLEEEQIHFQGKPLAIFIVCRFVWLAGRYKKSFLKTLPSKPITQAVFKGYRNGEGNFESQKSRAIEWAREFEAKIKQGA
ncbi:MAG: flavodoxin family protein [Candidatus Odinarchaeota archaeon]